MSDSSNYTNSPDSDNRKTVYLGDGVYAKFDGYGVWLLANSHEYPTDEIYIEPSVLRALNMAWQRWTRPGEEARDDE